MANNASDSNQAISASSVAGDVATHTSALLDLPAELIDMIATTLDTPSLLATRAACLKLRDDSTHEFRQRYFRRVEISGTSSSIRDLLDMFSSPNLPQAQRYVKMLVVRAPLIQRGWPIDLAHLHDHLAPDPRDIAHLLAAMPNLEIVKLFQDDYDGRYFQGDMIVLLSPQMFLTAIAASSSESLHLRHLTLIGMRIRGNDLADALEGQARGLRSVYCSEVTLCGREAWPNVLDIMRYLEIRSFTFDSMRFVNEEGAQFKIGFPVDALDWLKRIKGKGRRSNQARDYMAKFSSTLARPALELMLQGWQHRSKSA